MSRSKLAHEYRPYLLLKFLGLVKSYGGRDKFVKLIQYGSRLLMHLLRAQDGDLSARFKGLFAMTAQSRKLFRLLNPLNEYSTILQEIDKYDSKKSLIDRVISALTILSRFFFMRYFTYDNLNYLKMAKFLASDAQSKLYGSKAMQGWFYACVFGLLSKLLSIYKIHSTPSKTELGSSKKNDLYIASAGMASDMIVSGYLSNSFKDFLGLENNDGVIGFFGCLAALFSGYPMWKSA